MPVPPKDETGKRYGRLLVVERAGLSPHHKVLWRCVCDCGVECVKVGGDLRNGRISSCGCFRREDAVRRATTHKLSKTPIYRVWCNMINRCTDESNEHYHRYGGRGIRVCDRWFKFENFYEDVGDPPPGTTLDRKDNDGDYCKDNCRWATDVEQANNKSTNRVIEIDGERLTLKQWARRLGRSLSTFYFRISKGMTDREALLTPLHRGRREFRATEAGDPPQPRGE